MLSQSEIYHCDETFSVAPDVIDQVHFIHVVIENAVIPLVYAMRPNKTKKNKNEKLFGGLEQFRKKVVIDFEAAVCNAIRKTQPDTDIQTCFFHLGRAIWRNTQYFGFKRKYMYDDEF